MDKRSQKSADHGPQNPTERVKAESNFLRGKIAQELHEPTGSFTPDTAELLKFHGIYVQENRDQRRQLGVPAPKAKPAYSMMARVNLPGGWLSSGQLLTLMDLSDELAGGGLSVTSRQALQIHGIPKTRLREAIARIHAAGLSTRGACGDVGRNIMCCPAPYWGDPVHGEMRALAYELSVALRPRMAAYDEIWLNAPGRNGSPRPGAAADEEPLYGKTYLPHKFKVAVGLPGDNCVDLYVQDVGLMAICDEFHVIGYNVLVGGGMSTTPGCRDTFPALGEPLGFVSPEQAVELVSAILAIYRDHGNRADRRYGRLKYLTSTWGTARFRQEVQARLSEPLAPYQEVSAWDIDDHLGWHEQGDGRWFLGVQIPNGRLADTASRRTQTALAELCRRFAPSITITPNQSILVGDVRWEDRPILDDVLRRHGVPPDGDVSNLRRWASACVALPTCSKAVTESERVLESVLDSLEAEIARLGLANEIFSLRMTGCANGCSRPYNADIGLIGRAAGRYAIYLGGRRLGDRLGFLYREGIPLERIVQTLQPLLEFFRNNRRGTEIFGDFCHRLGLDGLNAALDS